MQVSVSIGFQPGFKFVDVQNNASFSSYTQICLLGMPWQPFQKSAQKNLSMECCYSTQQLAPHQPPSPAFSEVQPGIKASSALERQLLVAVRVRRELREDCCNALLMQPFILDLDFWHRSFLIIIMVDHYPLSVILDSACHAAKFIIMIIIMCV